MQNKQQSGFLSDGISSSLTLNGSDLKWKIFTKLDMRQWITVNLCWKNQEQVGEEEQMENQCCDLNSVAIVSMFMLRR